MADDEIATDGRSHDDFEGDPVVSSLLAQLESNYPDWRYTSHYTPEGRKVVMIEYADDQGNFTSGLPGDFVSLVSSAYDRPQDAGGDR